MTRRVYDPSPTQLELFAPAPVDFTKLAQVPLKNPCERPTTRLSADQVRCTYCGKAWDIDEPRPPCDTPDHHP